MLPESSTNLSSRRQNDGFSSLARCIGFLWMEHMSTDPVFSRIPGPDLMDIQNCFPVGLLRARRAAATELTDGRPATVGQPPRPRRAAAPPPSGSRPAPDRQPPRPRQVANPPRTGSRRAPDQQPPGALQIASPTPAGSRPADRDPAPVRPPRGPLHRVLERRSGRVVGLPAPLRHPR